MASSEPGSAMTSGSLKEVLEFLEGTIYFVQELTASNVPSLQFSTPRRLSCQLVVPRWFLREHGNKFRRLVLVRSGSRHKPWRFWLSFYTSPSRPAPQVSFASGWSDFVSEHGLVKGDHLIFSLTAMSEFHVYMFDQHGDPKITSQDLGLENWVMCQMCAKPTPAKREHELTGSVSSQESAYNNSRIEAQSERDSNQVSCQLPSFSWQLVAMNVSRLEIPMEFAEAHGSRLCCAVQLQGVLDASPVHDVQLVKWHREDRGSDPRIGVSMEGGAWEGFVRANRLWVGQALVFTLAGASLFRVREEICWNPRTGFQKRTPLCFL